MVMAAAEVVVVLLPNTSVLIPLPCCAVSGVPVLGALGARDARAKILCLLPFPLVVYNAICFILNS